MNVVPQRRFQYAPQTGDCAIAALATVMGWTYEEAATCCGIEIGADGKPDVPAGGLYLPEIAMALFRRGILTTNLYSTLGPPKDHRPLLLPSSDELMQLIKGHRALVNVRADEHGGHGLAWDGERLWNCQTPDGDPT